MELIVGGMLIPVEKDGTAEYLKSAAARLNLPAGALRAVKILSKSPVFGDPERFYYEVSLAVAVPSDYENKEKFPLYRVKPAAAYKAAASRRRPVIIGFGPAGMFAALELLEYGLKPLIFERGRKLQERHADVQNFIRDRALDPESNIQFGEGGAGSYSDGKLFSRLNNSPYASKVLDTFIKFGAPPEIGYISKPHLGTDVLRRIVANIRNYILERGGEIHYRSRMTDIFISGGAVSGVVINGADEYPASCVYLAVGNSARDTFELLYKKQVALESKPVSVGVRVEHPAKTINLIRYGEKYKNFTGLGAATYSFNYTNRKTGRGAYTFCMCPGGEIVNASSVQGQLALNGMSYAARNSAFSNSAIAVTCKTADYGTPHPLAGVEFQRDIESKAFLAGGGHWKAPAQNLRDFLAGRLSSAINTNSFKMGTRSAELKSIFPAFITETLVSAFSQWGDDCPLFSGEDAVLIGPETRTSSPVRMLRGSKYEANIRGLYPIGEGSGYSGGITSSASDALKAVEAAMEDAPVS
ncbi:MAG: dehydrogenase [Elusimicrobia bacterium CG_4_10_14_0_2_um_filter_56_8]|nr:MAG: dehydrogenase [Elusimicrobia bacterium CG1_02_56_21]PJA11886.1 MAG: dehydrogenase [Elusimicrobia bacterium CG_4_10_14_0_2_um_filter_56_8]